MKKFNFGLVDENGEYAGSYNANSEQEAKKWADKHGLTIIVKETN